MKTAEKARLYEEIKEYALEEFNIVLYNYEIEGYEGEEREILDKMNRVVKSYDEKWLYSYMEVTNTPFIEAVFDYDEYSRYYDYESYSLEGVVDSELFRMYRSIDWGILDCVLDCMDYEKYANEYLSMVEVEEGYLVMKE